jgi:prepilin-type N-terminal cleavage/methylation domain-containing protein
MPASFRGFTLIELLVVIAIIGILAALLFPVFARAKESANGSATLSNIRQLGVAMGLYESDHDDVGPNATDGPNGSGLEGGWVYFDEFDGPFDVRRGGMYPYVKIQNVYVGKGGGEGQRRGLDFAINSCLTQYVFTNSFSNGFNAGKPISVLPNPAETMQLGEETLADYEGQTVTNDGFLNFYTDMVSVRWRGKSHCLFADKHAKLVPIGGDRGAIWQSGGQLDCP